ncbi:MAG: hypothetical protein ACFE94_11025 [Candidatus Hodarchaeota archaeon]
MNIKEKFLDIAVILLLYTIATMLVFGFLDAILGTFMPYEVSYMGVDETDIESFNAELMEMISGYIRILGFTFISFGIVLIIILFVGFRKKEKWAYILTLLAILSLDIPYLVVLSPFMDLPFILVLINLIVQAVAMVISFKEFFGKE